MPVGTLMILHVLDATHGNTELHACPGALQVCSVTFFFFFSFFCVSNLPSRNGDNSFVSFYTESM